MYDVIIVGAGPFGATLAWLASQLKKRVLVIDKSGHVAGNCYTEERHGINVHVHGPHLFHCNDDRTWNFVNRFAAFNRYTHRVKVSRDDKIWSFPINLMTLHQLWGVTTPRDAEKKLQEARVRIDDPQNLEEWCLSQVGEELYELFIKHYTKKQWMTDPRDLPSSIIKRLPVRMTYDDSYFSDKHQGVPIGGYTNVFSGMLARAEVKLGIDYHSERSIIDHLLSSQGKLVYTGRIDELFGFDAGELPYRNLRFDHAVMLTPDHQGSAVINFTGPDVPFTRSTEHKHFEDAKSDVTVVTRELPVSYDRAHRPFYPINTAKNNMLAHMYRARAEVDGTIVGGRLGTYRYLDMNQVIASAFVAFEKTYGVRVNERGDVE